MWLLLTLNELCKSCVSLFIWACAMCVCFCNGSSGYNCFCNGSSSYDCFCNGSSSYNWPISNRPRWAWLTVGWSCHPACDPPESLKSETSSSVMKGNKCVTVRSDYTYMQICKHLRSPVRRKGLFWVDINMEDFEWKWLNWLVTSSPCVTLQRCSGKVVEWLCHPPVDAATGTHHSRRSVFVACTFWLRHRDS